MDFTATEVLLSQLEVQVCQLYGLFLKTTLELQSVHMVKLKKNLPETQKDMTLTA